MTDGVNTSVHPVQTAGEDPSSHRIVTYTHTEHLGSSDHSILPLRRPGDQSIGWVESSVHFTDKSPHPATSSPPIARLSPCCAS
jgi:hypothetical protein